MKLLLLWAMFFISLISFSQLEKKVNLKEFVVSSERIENTYSEEGKSVVIITKEQLKDIPAVSIGEILVQVAGIDIRQRGANGVQADAGIRGSTFDQVLILLNGVRMSDPQTGHHSLNIPVDVAAIERIEIIKGAGARVYGQNALAGVINVITKNPKETFVSLKATGGDFNLSDFSVAAGFKFKKTSHLISLNNNASNGYKENTDYNITNIFYSNETYFKTRKNGHPKLSFMAGFTEKKFGANGFYSSPLYKDQYEETQTSIASATYTMNLTENTEFSVKGYWRRNQDLYLFLRKNPSFYRNHHIGNTGGMNFNLVNKNKLGELGVGLDISQVWIQSNNLGNRIRKTQRVFLEHKFNFLKNKLHITPGIQASYYSDFDGVLLPGIDLSYEIDKIATIFGNAGYTYRVPTYTDLYYVSRTNIGNSSLKPEIALNYEFGLRRVTNKMNIQASYFVREGKNIIDWTRKNDSVAWQPNNLIELNTQGVDVNFSVTPSEFAKSLSFIKSINLGYVFMNQNSTVEDGILSKYALENLKHQFTGSISFKYCKNITHSFLYRYTDRVNLEDYSVFDTKITYNNGKLLIFGEVSNLLNQEYRETNYVVMPGRWFRIGVGYTFKKNN